MRTLLCKTIMPHFGGVGKAARAGAEKKFSGGTGEAARPLKISLSYRPMSALGFVPLFEI